LKWGKASGNMIYETLRGEKKKRFRIITKVCECIQGGRNERKLRSEKAQAKKETKYEQD